jgi:hypothetical protein
MKVSDAKVQPTPVGTPKPSSSNVQDASAHPLVCSLCNEPIEFVPGSKLATHVRARVPGAFHDHAATHAGEAT